MIQHLDITCIDVHFIDIFLNMRNVCLMSVFNQKYMYAGKCELHVRYPAPNVTKVSSDLYLCYRIEDLITPHYWPCSSELCMNFVFAYCVMISTNKIAYFKRSAVLNGGLTLVRLPSSQHPIKKKSKTCYITNLIKIRWLIEQHPIERHVRGQYPPTNQISCFLLINHFLPLTLLTSNHLQRIRRIILIGCWQHFYANVIPGVTIYDMLLDVCVANSNRF